MIHVNIFHVAAYIAALYVEIVKVGHGHYDYLCVHFQKQRDKLVFTDKVGLYLLLFPCNVENNIVRVTGHIVYGDV